MDFRINLKKILENFFSERGIKKKILEKFQKILTENSSSKNTYPLPSPWGMGYGEGRVSPTIGGLLINVKVS